MDQYVFQYVLKIFRRSWETGKQALPFHQQNLSLKASGMRQLLNMLVEEDKVEVSGKNRNRRYRKK